MGRLLGGAVGRCWRAQRLQVLEAWRIHATALRQERRWVAAMGRREALHVAFCALLAATQDAWWLHTILGSWKNLVCAEALERVCAGAACPGHCTGATASNAASRVKPPRGGAMPVSE